jgi:hypothetical protein
VTTCDWYQRWLPGGRHTWTHPSVERYSFNPASYGVTGIPEKDAREFVEELHYLHAWLNARLRYGMFYLEGPQEHLTGRLVGVAVLSVPQNKLVLTNPFPHLEPYYESLEVGRFILLDQVPHDAETWFFGEVRRLAATTGIRGLVMFSDPVPQWDDDGNQVMPGHVGGIYQATAGTRYTGPTGRRGVIVLPDGTVLGERTAQKIRQRERGHEAAERRLIRLGAVAPRAGQDQAAWLAGALSRVDARRVMRDGKLRYVMPVGNRRERARVQIEGPSLPFPKKHLGQLLLPFDVQRGRTRG